METVALPMKCGLAGDVVALYRRAGEEFRALVSIGAAPGALAAGETLERLGPRSIGVPGAPDGYASLHRLGRLPLERLVAPAIEAARVGVPWTEVALAYLDESSDVLERYSPTHPYRVDGRRPKPGEIRRLPGLGAWLSVFAESGAELFAGPQGQRFLAEVQARGGILRNEDLLARPARDVETYAVMLDGGERLIVTPAPTAGPRLVDLMQRSRASAAALPELVRTEREETRERGRTIIDEGTSVVTAADDEGNVVVVVHSNSFPRFGSGVVLDDGLVLNNRPGRGFDLSAPSGAPNAPAAGRVPQTTLHAWALQRGERIDVGATPGGVNQLTWNAQTIADLLAGVDPRDAVTRPRWAFDEKDHFSAEEGITLPDSFRARALPRFAHRSVQQIATVHADGLASVAADPRAGGVALGSYARAGR